MKIIVGLGNPGKRYRSTPHNIGFEVADCLSKRWRGSFVPGRRVRADSMETTVSGEGVLLVKPTTFMNLSGGAVRELMRNRPVELSDLLVVFDDINLDIGRLRIRRRGTCGGHNGLRSVIECLGSEEFARMRIGVRPEAETGDYADYLLSGVDPTDRARLGTMVEVAADAAECWLREGSDVAANRFNGYREEESA